VKRIIAVVHNDEHVQIGLGIPLTPRARTVKDDAEHAIAEARPQAVEILVKRCPLLRLELSQSFDFHDNPQSVSNEFPEFLQFPCEELKELELFCHDPRAGFAAQRAPDVFGIRHQRLLATAF